MVTKGSSNGGNKQACMSHSGRYLHHSGVKINLLHQKWVALWGLITQAKNTAASLGPPKFNIS